MNNVNIQSILQLNRHDLRDIVRATNPVSGVGISVVPNNNSMVISLDLQQFKRLVYSFCRQAWPSACPARDNIDDIDLGAEIS